MPILYTNVRNVRFVLFTLFVAYILFVTYIVKLMMNIQIKGMCFPSHEPFYPFKIFNLR